MFKLLGICRGYPYPWYQLFVGFLLVPASRFSAGQLIQICPHLTIHKPKSCLKKKIWKTCTCHYMSPWNPTLPPMPPLPPLPRRAEDDGDRAAAGRRGGSMVPMVLDFQNFGVHPARIHDSCHVKHVLFLCCYNIFVSPTKKHVFFFWLLLYLLKPMNELQSVTLLSFAI